MKLAPRVFALLAGTLGAALLVVGAGMASIAPTTAAWTDPVHVALVASAGEWGGAAPSPSQSVIRSGNSETELLDTSWQIASGLESLSFCATSTVTGSQPDPRPWELRADMAKAPFNGMSGTGGIYYSGSTQVVFSNPPGEPGTLVIRGKSNPGSPWNADWNNALLTDQQTLQIVICVSTAPPPAAGDPSWYGATQSPSGNWSSTLACVKLEVTGLVTDLVANPFYYGWSAAIDLTAAKAHIVAAGKTLGYLEWSPDPSSGWQFLTDPASYNPAGDSYQIASGRMTAIRGTGTTAVTACVHGY